MKSIYVLSGVMENSTRALQRVAGLFARNRLDIEQITVYRISNKDQSLFNIVIKSDKETIQHVIRQLQKVIDLVDVQVSKVSTVARIKD